MRFIELGEAMKVEDDQGFFQTVAKENDKTTSYLFVCLLLSFFFAVFLLGLLRTQTVSDQVTSDAPPFVREVLPEIGDSIEASKK